MGGRAVSGPAPAVSVALRLAALAGLLVFPGAVDGWQEDIGGVLGPASTWVSLALLLGLLLWAWYRVGAELSKAGTRLLRWLIGPYAVGLCVLVIAIEMLLGPGGEGLIFLCALAGGLSGAVRGVVAFAGTGARVFWYHPMSRILFILGTGGAFLWRQALTGSVGWHSMNPGRADVWWLGAGTDMAIALMVMCEMLGARAARGPISHGGEPACPAVVQ